MNILFICSRNQWRSPTAEQVWRNYFKREQPGFSIRSAGTSPRARRTVTQNDIRWADRIFVMEDKHRKRLQAEFRQLLTHKPVQVLGIPDHYSYMDPDLVELLEAEAEAFWAEQRDVPG